MSSVTPESTSRWWTGLAFAVLVGAMVRFAGINVQSFWYDEAYSARIAEQATTWELFSGQRKDNGNPPLYYIAHRWTAKLLGNTEAAHRMFAALCGVLTIPIIGLLARRLQNGTAGLIVAWLFALSPLSVELSNEARVYSFVHLITALDALLFVKWLSTQRWRDGLIYMLITGIACYAHYFIVFFIFSHLFAVLLLPNRIQAFVKWCVLMLGVAALWAAWVPAFLQQVGTPGNLSRMSHAWKMQFASTPVVFSVGRTFAWRDAGLLLLGVAGMIALIGFCLPALIGWWRLFRTNKAEAVLLAGWVIFPVAIPLVVAILASPIYHHRYGSVGLPAFLCLVAIGLAALSTQMRAISVTAIALGTAFSLTNYYTQPIKDDWRAAAPVVLAEEPHGQLILTDQDIEILPLLYYAKRQGQIPAEMYGLSAFDETESRLRGVKYDAGKKIDKQPVDHTERILSAQSICLALCVPEHTLAEYRRLFEQHGFQLTGEAEFYRITVARFERRPGLAGGL